MVNLITPNMPYEMYRQLDGINISTLKEMSKSPMHYKHRLTNPKQTNPLTLGSAIHTAILEPERFLSDYVVWDRLTDGGNLAPRRGQFWDTFCRENEGKEIITFDENITARNIAASVRSNPTAMKYLEKGYAEVVMQWEMHDRQCRGRVDWLCKVDDRPVVVGIKSSRDCRSFYFGKQGYQLGYHLQWAWYHDGYSAIKKGVIPRMVEIVIENGDVPAVTVFEITHETLKQGRSEYIELLAKLKECETADKWPGPHEGEIAFALPAYAFGNDISIDEEVEST